MKIENANLTALDLSASGNSDIVWVGTAALGSVQLVVTGTAPTGTFQVQLSNDPGFPSAQAKTWQISGVSNFGDLANASKAITATGTYIINVPDIGGLWLRISYTRTSGTGSAAIRVVSKGV